MTPIIVFAKPPVAGSVKTRLCPALSPAGAARVYGHMLEHTVAQAKAAGLGPVWLYATPDASHPSLVALVRRHALLPAIQRGADIGERMCNAMAEVLADASACLLVGSDVPSLAASDHCRAARALSDGADLALGPTADGGYGLIAARQCHPELFRDMPWSTPQVAAETLRRAEALGLRAHLLRILRDIDRARDLALIPAQWRLPPSLTGPSAPNF